MELFYFHTLIIVYTSILTKFRWKIDFSQNHHPAFHLSNHFSSRSYQPEEQTLVQQHNQPPSVIFGQRVTSKDKYLSGHLNAINSNSDKRQNLEQEYFDYAEYNEEEDEYYDDEYDDDYSSYNLNSSSPVIPVQYSSEERHTHIPLRPSNSNHQTSNKLPNRRNSYMHYNHHGTYLPLTPPRSETHYGSYEHINRRPHR